MKKQAGAEGFTDYGYGTNANRVFQELREEAQYEHGNRGYTGTIAEKDGFVMATREVMTEKQAREYADKHYDDYDKWGDAGCVAFGEEKVLVEKDFEVKVSARNKEEAIKKVREKMMGGKKRAGATIEVEITWNATKLTTPAGKRKITTEKSNGDVYFLKHYDAHTKYSSKKEAVAALKKILEKALGSKVLPVRSAQLATLFPSDTGDATNEYGYLDKDTPHYGWTGHLDGLWNGGTAVPRVGTRLRGEKLKSWNASKSTNGVNKTNPEFNANIMNFTALVGIALSDQMSLGSGNLGVLRGGHRHMERFFRCLLYTSPSPRDRTRSRMPSSA